MMNTSVLVTFLFIVHTFYLNFLYESHSKMYMAQSKAHYDTIEE